MASEREEGYYWVKIDEHSDWLLAWYECCGFWEPASLGHFDGSRYAEIGERITREPSVEQALDQLRLAIIRSVISKHLNSPEFQAELAAKIEELKQHAR